jgi:hypothetical protein
VWNFYRVVTKLKSTQSIKRGSKKSESCDAIKGKRVGAKAKRFLIPGLFSKRRGIKGEVKPPWGVEIDLPLLCKENAQR